MQGAEHAVQGAGFGRPGEKGMEGGCTASSRQGEAVCWTCNIAALSNSMRHCSDGCVRDIDYLKQKQIGLHRWTGAALELLIG